MTGISTLPSPMLGGRERKKARTRADLSAAARRLTLEHGLESVTIQQIVDAAEVSMRTFFNYFECKEDAVLGVDPGSTAEIVEMLAARPADETPFVALIRVLERRVSDPDLTDVWLERTELVARYPSLLPRHLAAMADVESALVVAVAQRIGCDPARDPSPTVIVASVVAVLRASFAWWMDSDRRQSRMSVLDKGFATLAVGFTQ